MSRFFSSSWQCNQQELRSHWWRSSGSWRATSVHQEDDENVVRAVDADAEGLADDFAFEVPQWNHWQSWSCGHGGIWPQWRRATNSDPPGWPGWETRQTQSMDVPVHRRADQVLRLFNWNIWQKFVHVDDEDWESHCYPQRMLGRNPAGRRDRQDGAVRLNKPARRVAATTRTAVRPGGTARSRAFPALPEVSCAKKGPSCLNQVRRISGCSPLDLWGMLVTRLSNRQLASVKMIGESDDEVFHGSMGNGRRPPCGAFLPGRFVEDMFGQCSRPSLFPLRPTTIRTTQRKAAVTGTRPIRRTSSPTCQSAAAREVVRETHVNLGHFSKVQCPPRGRCVT